MKSTIILILLMCMTKAFAQKDQLLTPEQLKEDADFYFKTLYEKHPDPYYYYSLNEFEDKKNEIYAQLNKPLTHEQFAWIIGEINSYVDVHSRIYIYLQTHWRKPFALDEKIFPVVKIKNNKLYLKENNTEILEINGIKADDILHDYNKYFNQKLPSEPNANSMEIIFHSFIRYKYNIKSPFKVRFANAVKEEIIDGYSLKKFNQESSLGWRGDGVCPVKLYPYSSIGIFNIEGFQDGGKEAFDNLLEIFFRGVRNMNIKNIFYDLSFNCGGSFSAFYSDLKALDIIKHDTISFRLNKTKRSNQTNKKYRLNETVLLPNNEDSIISKERRLFVIQGVNTGSCGDYFCRIVAENKLGTLVGQNTGEPTVAFTDGLYYTMPNSKIQFIVAEALFDFSDHFKDETLHPDVYWDVNNTREFTEQELIDIINHCNQ